MVDKGYDFEGVQRQAQTALIISAVALAILVLVLIIVCRGKFSWRYLKQKFQPAKVKTFYSLRYSHVVFITFIKLYLVEKKDGS